MIQRYIAFLCVLSFLVMPMSIAHGTEPLPTDTSTSRQPNTLESKSYDIFLAQLTAISSYLDRTYSKREGLTTDELRTSIYEGVNWLKTAQEESGHFRYEYLPYEGTYRNDDNMVRQAGALYALGEVLQSSDTDSFDVSDTMQNAIEYFKTMSRKGTVGDTTFRCIVRSDASTQCPLGATALALVGILNYVSLHPENESEYADLIRDYGAYILAMQKENGGFTDMFNVRGSTANEKESPFSNGEALLALVRLYMYAPNPLLESAIDRAFTYLKDEPFDSALYLWIMAALKDMQIIWPSNSMYVPYTRAFTTWRIEGAINYSNPTRNYCAYAEGLASAYTILEKKSTAVELTPIRTQLNSMHARHQALQIGSHDMYRILTEDGVLALKKIEDVSRAKGGFLTGDAEPTERIDFTQHCMTAYLHTLVDINEAPL